MWPLKVDGEIATPLVVYCLFSMVRYMIDRNADNTNIDNQNTQNEVHEEINLSNGRETNQEVSSCSFHENEVEEGIILPSGPEPNQAVFVRQARNRFDEGGREDNTRSDQPNYTSYIGKSEGNTLIGANINPHSYHGTAVGVNHDNRTVNHDNRTVNYITVINVKKYSDKEERALRKRIKVEKNLKKYLNLINLRKFSNRTYPFKSDDEFSYYLERIYIEPVINITSISTVVDLNGHRFLLEAKYGMGKRTWSKHMALRIASGNGNCPFFDTTNNKFSVVCDVTKMIEELKSHKSFEDVLISYIHKNNKDLVKLNQTKQLLSQNSEQVILFITGSEFIQDKEIQIKIKNFFKRGFENPTVFESSRIIYSDLEYDGKTSQRFLDNFDYKLTLVGVPKEEYQNMIKKTFEIDDAMAVKYRNRLEDLGLKFVADISPRMYVVSYHIYNEHNPKSSMEFLSKLLLFEGVEYLKQCKRVGSPKDLEPEVESIFLRIAQHLWKTGHRSRTYQDTIFEDKDFDKQDLRMVRDLGLLVSNDGKVFRVCHQLIYEFFVVCYLNSRFQRKSLESKIKEFDKWNSNIDLDVVCGISENEYCLNCIYISPLNHLFTLALYRLDDTFQVQYFIYGDFSHGITPFLGNNFIVEIEGYDGRFVASVPSIIPIKIKNGHYLKDLIVKRMGDYKISIMYPTRYSGPRCCHIMSNLANNTYSYSIKIEGLPKEVVYRLKFLSQDFFSIRQFVSGVNKTLFKWSSILNFAIKEQSLRLIFDDLSFANKVVNIGFGIEISEEGSKDLLEAINDWRYHLVNLCEEQIENFTWMISSNNVSVASSTDSNLNLSNVHLGEGTVLGIALKY